VKKKVSIQRNILFIASAIVFIAIILLVSNLASRITSLTAQVAELEVRGEALTTKLATYERSLCESFAVMKSDSLKRFTLTSAGYERTYQVHTPANYDPSVRYPVVINFDGIDGSGSQMRAYSGLDALPAIAVYPDSLMGTQGFTAWQGAPYSLEGDYDVEFVKAILSVLPTQYCVDQTQVFAVGMSNGGAFATIVGCKLGDQIRAVASVSGAYYSTCEREERTPSYLVFHSAEDNRVPFNGWPARKLPQIPRWVDEQAKDRDCKTKLPAVKTGSATSYNWQDCADGSMLRLVVVRKQGHGWLSVPNAPKEPKQSTAQYIWEFFRDSVNYS